MGFGKSNFIRYFMLVSFIPLILSIGIIPTFSFAQQNTGFSDYVKPYKQMSNGALPHDVFCSDDKILIVRNNGKPACVKLGTGTNWESAGMGKTNPTENCKPGYATLENPNTAAIICEDQDKAQKYINQGWESLDETPPMKLSPGECREGETKLKNPGTGSIVCKLGGQAQKYEGRGWVPVT